MSATLGADCGSATSQGTAATADSSGSMRRSLST